MLRAAALGRAPGPSSARTEWACDLVTDVGEVWLLDLDGMRRLRTNVAWRRERDKDRRRFMKNWKDLPRYEVAFRACVDTD